MTKSSLLVEYHDGDRNFGEIVELDALTDAEVRAMARDWLEPCRDPPYTFICKDANGTYQLVDLAGDFKIADSDGKIITVE